MTNVASKFDIETVVEEVERLEELDMLHPIIQGVKFCSIGTERGVPKSEKNFNWWKKWNLTCYIWNVGQSSWHDTGVACDGRTSHFRCYYDCGG